MFKSEARLSLTLFFFFGLSSHYFLLSWLAMHILFVHVSSLSLSLCLCSCSIAIRGVVAQHVGFL